MQKKPWNGAAVQLSKAKAAWEMQSELLLKSG